MIDRRTLLAAALVPGALAVAGRLAPARAQTDSFAAFLAALRQEALHAGISVRTLDQALRGIQVNQRVLERDRHQPESTMTWERYRALVLNDQRIAAGREATRKNQALMRRVDARFGVDPRTVAGIWGLESNYGTRTGDFHVVEALATLAWDGRRAKFFRSELMAALKILDHGDVTSARMLGSYAGAMGQPQFMPTSYLRMAVDFDGDGKRDIWTSNADVVGSIANYLARSGWRAGETWGQRVQVPADFDASLIGRRDRRPVREWARLGVRPVDGARLPDGEASRAMVLPDGSGGEAYLVGDNFFAIRRYNPSDFYAIGVGSLGDLVGA
jgi:membrane-bound lytic murein transglycosylase B